METRRSSRTKAAAATAAEASESTTSPPRDAAIDTPHDSAAATPTTSSTDTTHLDQTSAQHHEKKDQSLEASDPDMNAASTEDQVHDAVATPINDDIESAPPKGDHEGAMEHKEEDESVDDEPVHEVHLVGHIKGVPRHHPEEHKKNNDHEAKKTEAHFEHHPHSAEGHHHTVQGHHHSTEGHHHPTEGHHHSTGGHHHTAEGHHHTTEGHHHSTETHHNGGDEAAKHVKRPVEVDSNTEGLAVDVEAQDYLTGAYKSPFRHTHKGEQAGKQER